MLIPALSAGLIPILHSSVGQEMDVGLVLEVWVEGVTLLPVSQKSLFFLRQIQIEVENK